MGRKLDVLFGRSSRMASKLKAILVLAVSRCAVLRNHRQVRCKQARGDVAQLLQLGQLDRAFLRVEQVIKEQNMLDVLGMIEGYCLFVTERVALLEHAKECPEELREAVSSLIFAASRCGGELPELEKARSKFASMFGREFDFASVELRNSCSVNPKMSQKLSTKQPSLEIRQMTTKEIAAEKGIKLDFDEPSDEMAGANPSSKQQAMNPQTAGSQKPEYEENSVKSNGSFNAKTTHVYKDAVTAAQAAFESAAFAAAAARAAVELSRTESGAKGDGSNRGTPAGREQSKQAEAAESYPGSLVKKADMEEHSSSESEGEISEIHMDLIQKEISRKEFAKQVEGSYSSSSGSTELSPRGSHMDSGVQRSVGRGEEKLFHTSDDETERFGASRKQSLLANKQELSYGNRPEQVENLNESPKKNQLPYLNPPYYRRGDQKNYVKDVNDTTHKDVNEKQSGAHLTSEQRPKPVSMRTRRGI